MEIEEAVAVLAANISPITDTLSVPLEDSFRCILAQDLYAPVNVPPFCKSAMDGYAVHSADIAHACMERPAVLEVAGELFAGDRADICARPGTAVRVMTGSPVPDGYNAVVRQEDTDCGSEVVKVFAPVQAYRNCCRTGEDIRQGALVMKKGTRILRSEIGMLAGMGFGNVRIIRPARVAMICTGSELSKAGSPLEPGKIYPSIAPMLNCAIKAEALQTTGTRIVADDRKLIAHAIKSAVREADFIITTGGMSVGKKDLVRSVLGDIGARPLFSRVNIQPGTPTQASILDNKVILSLSGNPFAALVNFDLYFYEAMAVLMSSGSLRCERTKAVLSAPFEKSGKMRRLVRARLCGGKVFPPDCSHASSTISSMSGCNCYMDISPDTRCSIGDTVDVFVMRGTVL